MEPPGEALQGGGPGANTQGSSAPPVRPWLAPPVARVQIEASWAKGFLTVVYTSPHPDQAAGAKREGLHVEGARGRRPAERAQGDRASRVTATVMSHSSPVRTHSQPATFTPCTTKCILCSLFVLPPPPKGDKTVSKLMSRRDSGREEKHPSGNFRVPGREGVPRLTSQGRLGKHVWASPSTNYKSDFAICDSAPTQYSQDKAPDDGDRQQAGARVIS